MTPPPQHSSKVILLQEKLTEAGGNVAAGGNALSMCQSQLYKSQERVVHESHGEVVLKDRLIIKLCLLSPWAAVTTCPNNIPP